MQNKKKNTKKTIDSADAKVESSPKTALQSEKRPTKLTTPVIAGIIVILIAALLFYFKGLLIAATVNGQPITRLSVVRELENQNGSKTLDSLITKVLIFQEAQKKKINIADKEIDADIKKIEEQVATQGQNLDQLLTMQGMGRNQLKEQIRIQKIIEKLLGNKAAVTDKEVEEYIQTNEQSLPANLQGEDLKTTVKQQLQQQKLSKEFQTWIEEARKNSKISSFVSY